MQLGIYSKTFDRPNLGAVLDAVKAHGLACVQFNMLSAGVPTLPDALDANVIEMVRRETTARGIRVTALSGTFNMAHPDRAERQHGLAQLRILAEASAALGAPILSLCSGTRELSSMWHTHPDNVTPQAWRDLVDCMEKVEVVDDTECIDPQLADILHRDIDTLAELQIQNNQTALLVLNDRRVESSELPGEPGAQVDPVLDYQVSVLFPDPVRARLQGLTHLVVDRKEQPVSFDLGPMEMPGVQAQFEAVGPDRMRGRPLRRRQRRRVGRDHARRG